MALIYFFTTITHGNLTFMIIVAKQSNYESSKVTTPAFLSTFTETNSKHLQHDKRCRCFSNNINVCLQAVAFAIPKAYPLCPRDTYVAIRPGKVPMDSNWIINMLRPRKTNPFLPLVDSIVAAAPPHDIWIRLA